MRKASRLLFYALAMVACFQLTGLEEAFCEDSVTEAACRDCMTCVDHQFAGIADHGPVKTAGFSGYLFSEYSFHPLDGPLAALLRPPIAR